MRKLIGGAVLVASLVGIPAVAAAQHSDAKHEFGVDLALAYVKCDGCEGFVALGTPIDLRVGFISGAKLTIEPRITLAYISDDTDFGGTGDPQSDFDLGANITYGMQSNRSGLYLTGGAAIDLLSAGGASESFFSVNVGVGTRVGYGSGALRLEAFVDNQFEKTGVAPSILSFGARVGLSLWH